MKFVMWLAVVQFRFVVIMCDTCFGLFLCNQEIHLNTLTFYYINLKPPPTAMSIKNKPKRNTFPSYVFFLSLHLYKYTNPVYGCTGNYRMDLYMVDDILFDVEKALEMYTKQYAQGNNILFMP